MLIGLITDWPWKTAAYISGNSETNEPQKCFTFCQWFYVCIRLGLAVMGMIIQTITCFRRDRLDQSVIEGNNGSKSVQCNGTSQVFSAFVVPNLIVLGILLWLLWRKFKGKCYKVSRSMELADKDIIDLVEEVNKKKPDTYMTRYFLIYFIVFMVSSLVVSILNLYAYDIMDDDVIIHSEWNNYSGSSKKSLITLSFFGFVAFDLLYAQFIMRYACQCKLNIYYLEEIKNKTKNSRNEPRQNDNYAYTNQDAALDDVEKAYNYLKQLNSNSTAVGIIILLTTLLAANSIISLLDKGSTIFQEVALGARSLQWVTLTMFTLYYAAQVNETSKALHDTGLSMYRRPMFFNNNEDIAQKKLVCKHTSPINLEAKLFGIVIRPWLPYVIIILMLFTLMVGPGFRWYEHLF